MELDISKLNQLTDIWWGLDQVHQVAKGKILLAAKDVFLEHDKRAKGFRDWHKDNLNISPQSARRYMKLAENEEPPEKPEFTIGGYHGS